MIVVIHGHAMVSDASPHCTACARRWACDGQAMHVSMMAACDTTVVWQTAAVHRDGITATLSVLIG
jgi:hypothetical protein